MPIPFLIAGGLALGAGLLGVGGHLEAKETNRKATEKAEAAKHLYSKAKNSLENSKRKTTEALLNLEKYKRDILESSMKQFLRGYQRVKHIEIRTPENLCELSNFSIRPQDMLQIQKLTDIYESSLKSGAAGVVTGMALAAMPGVGLLGAAAVTPLAAIAAPVILFTGISAAMKADENLEKAEVMYAEAEAAAEAMKVQETKCRAIIQKTEMYGSLLNALNRMFSECARYLDSVTRKKKGFLGLRRITEKRLSQEEMNLIAISRSLAGAVKSVIDAPVLDSRDDFNRDSEETYDNVSSKMISFQDASGQVLSYDYRTKIKPAIAPPRHR